MKEKLIIDALTERLKAITTKNGFNYDLQGEVYQGHYYYTSIEELPLAIVIPTEEGSVSQSIRNNGKQYIFDTKIAIEGHVEVDRGDLTNVYLLCDDLTKALITNDKNLSGLVKSMTLDSVRIVGAEQKDIEAVVITLSINYFDEIGD